MKNIQIYLFPFLLIFYFQAPAQLIPLDRQYQQRLQEKIMQAGKPFLGTMKPWPKPELDSLINVEQALYATDSISRLHYSWAGKKLFAENFIKLNKGIVKLTIDPLMHFGIGTEPSLSRTSWINMRGVTFNGSIGNNFTFNSELYENQAVFPSWINDYVNAWGVIPGCSNYKAYGKNGFDYTYIAGWMNYRFSTWFNATLGYGKNFIGDGYRSLILSDNSPNYPYLKLNASWPHFKYTALYAQFMERHSTTHPNFGFDRRWMAAHFYQFLLWNKLELGLYDAIVWEAADSTGTRGFDPYYINPITVIRPMEQMNNMADNAFIGITAKYRINKQINIYGQLMIDELKTKEIFSGKGWWGNKTAFQLGVSGWNLFNIPALDALVEFNQIRPYTYSHWTIMQSYSHYAQPLAHPLGANLREVVGLVSYKYRNWEAYTKLNMAMYGLNKDDKNYGQNIFLNYEKRVQDYDNHVGQGLKTHLNILEANVSYLLNRHTNLRIEAGAIKRQEKNAYWDKNTVYLYAGIRTGLRNLYNDF